MAIANKVPDGLVTDQLARRYAARIVDSLLSIVIGGILIFGVFFLLAAAGVGSQKIETMTTLAIVLMQCLTIVYESLFESSRFQATPGKMWCSLKVYNASGGCLTLLQAFARSVLKKGPFMFLSYLPGSQLTMIAWTLCHLIVIHKSPVFQAIHDKVIGSWVAAPQTTIQLNLS